jgi:phospholipid transport system transporter-binding protein
MKLPPQATLEQAAALAQALPAAVTDGNGVLRIDASDLRSFDSSAIALLMQARRMAQAAGRGFEVAGAPAKLAELARLYGVEELLALRSGTPAA